MARLLLLALTILSTANSVYAQKGWRTLFDGTTLNRWEVEGEGIWTPGPHGILTGQRPVVMPGAALGWPITEKQYRTWFFEQSWLYTKDEFGDFDLHVEFWIAPERNSGVSICDPSRGKTSFGPPPHKTPAHIGYEIQLLGSEDSKEKNLTGSIYGIHPARGGLQHVSDWNSLDVEHRKDYIRVRVNGQTAAEGPADPARPIRGPIGLQLHDRNSWMMFRNIKIREIK
jgi:hypothetical protein